MKKVGIIVGKDFRGSHITKQFLENGFKLQVATIHL